MNDYVRLINGMFPTGLPPWPDFVLVPRVLDVLMMRFAFFRTAPLAVLENLEGHLIEAVATLRTEASELVN